MRGRLFIIVLALAAVAIAYVASGGGGSDDKEKPDSAARSPAPADAMRISLAYSPEKEEMLVPLIKRFNDERHLSGGRPVFVDAKVRNSGDVEAEMARGREGPVMWSPSSSFWGRLLNYDADRRLVADENPSIVRTPVVIAMWKRLADAYGYPERELGYKELDQLATRGWAAVGKPQFGAFKYVHTNPDFSTSGLSAVSASYYAAVGKREGLTAADVARGRPKVRRLERAIVHYGDNTLFISEEMRRHGLGYASAVAMEETTLIEFNQNAGDGEKLVAVYPSEGTFVSDNPLITLHGDWVSPAERKAAAVFAAYLREAVTPEVAGEHGFRPSDLDAEPAGLVTEANGVDPDEPEHVLTVPEPRVLARIKAAWHTDRKPANVMLVFDTSASMSDGTEARPGQGGAAGVLPRGGPAGPRGPDEVLQQDHGAGPDRADEGQPREAHQRDRRTAAGGGHARPRRDARGRKGGGGQARPRRDQRRRRAHGRPGHRVGSPGVRRDQGARAAGAEGVRPGPGVHDRLRQGAQRSGAREVLRGVRRQELQGRHR